MKTSGHLIFLVFAANLFIISCSAPEERLPNILMIMTDQQAWFAARYSGNDEIITPNIDRLASEGAIFGQAVTPCPVCVPARTAILTGSLLESSEVWNNRDVSNTCNLPSFDEILADHGYHAEYAGKFHAPHNLAGVYSNPDNNEYSGLEQILRWGPLYREYLSKTVLKRPLENGELYESTFYGALVPYKLSPLDRRYKYLPSGIIPEEELEQRSYGQGDVHGVLDLSPEHTITAMQGKQTLNALERVKDGPFTLTCSFHCPHVPITPSEPYVSMYNRNDLSIPPSIHHTGENFPYAPKKFEEGYSDEELLPDMILNYYAFVTEIDAWVGRILNKLDALGLTENTMVIFVSDHGEMLGAHGMRGKFNFYEESVRVPLIIKYPGKIKGGQTINNPVSTLNLFATILDYAGIEEIPGDGYSLRGMMEGEKPLYDFAVSEWDWENINVPSIMIRTGEWKLMTTHRSGGKDVEVLIDLLNDPNEMDNLLGSNPDRFLYNDVVKDLKSKLCKYLEDVGSPLAEGVKNREIIRK